jgi:hypothetical protein
MGDEHHHALIVVVSGAPSRVAQRDEARRGAAQAVGSLPSTTTSTSSLTFNAPNSAE